MVYLPPGLLISLLLAGIYAALFHLLRGQTAKELLYFAGASVVGFLVGEGITRLLGLGGPMLGDIHLLYGTLGAWAGLLAIYWWGMTRT